MPQLSTNQTAPSNSDDLDAVVEAAVARAYHWMEATAEADADDASTQQLAELLRDENGVRFTMDFVDRVMRPESNRVAAQALRAITRGVDAVSYTHLTLPTKPMMCRSRWSPYH